MLKGYFYTKIFICKTHFLLLAVCYYLKTNNLASIYNCLHTIWINSLTYSDLIAFAKDYKDWFLLSSFAD